MKIKQQYKNYLKENFFLLYKHLYKPASRLFMFEEEKKLLSNGHIEASDLQSILFFTTYKCASCFAGEIINELTTNAGDKHVNFDSYFYHLEKDTDIEYEKIFSKNVFRASGFIYGPMRNYQPIPGIKQYKTLLILRDPRDVLVSYTRHSFNSIKNTLLDMTTSDNCIFTNKNLVNLLGSWSDHYNSWKRINKNFLLIKYEDLIENKKKEIIKILTKISVSEEKINNCINTTTFENMKNMEEKGFFEEQAIDEKTGKKINFFHKGKNNQWKDFLDTSTIKKIEENFETEMKELKYI